MPRVTIKIEEGIAGIGPLTEVTVRETTTAAALAKALAAVMPRVRGEWQALIRAARLVQAATGQAPAQRSAASSRPGSPGGTVSGRAAVSPVPGRLEAHHLAGWYAALLGAWDEAMAGLRAALNPSQRPPGWALPQSRLVLPAEAREWNSDHPEGPLLYPGSQLMSAELTAGFLAWRAVKAAEAQTSRLRDHLDPAAGSSEGRSASEQSSASAAEPAPSSDRGRVPEAPEAAESDPPPDRPGPS